MSPTLLMLVLQEDQRHKPPPSHCRFVTNRATSTCRWQCFWDMACSLSLVAPSQASYCWWGRSTAGPSH
jgi:hypothetical protein